MSQPTYMLKNPPERWRTAREIWELLGISEQTFYRRRKTGLIPSPGLDDGAIKRWLWSDVQAHIKRRKMLQENTAA